MALFPYSNFHDLNMDWIIKTLKQIIIKLENLPSGGGGAVDSVNGKTGTVILNKSDIGLGNVDNIKQYSTGNPPPYPVQSVNGLTGAVMLTIPTAASDIGAISAPVSPALGSFLIWDGNAWIAQTLSVWEAGEY